MDGVGFSYLVALTTFYSLFLIGWSLHLFGKFSIKNYVVALISAFLIFCCVGFVVNYAGNHNKVIETPTKITLKRITGPFSFLTYTVHKYGSNEDIVTYDIFHGFRGMWTCIGYDRKKGVIEWINLSFRYALELGADGVWERLDQNIYGGWHKVPFEEIQEETERYLRLRNWLYEKYSPLKNTHLILGGKAEDFLIRW